MNAIIRLIGRQPWGTFVVGVVIALGWIASAWGALQDHTFWPEWFRLFGVLLFVGAGLLPNRLAPPVQFVILILLCWAILDGKPLTLATLAGLSWDEKAYLGFCPVFGLLGLIILFRRPVVPAATLPARQGPPSL